MNVPYTRAPHQGAPGLAGADSPHAALLIDFDNVTMGMRSDLSKELKSLLDSDVIKGKVSVQRAYADWRRYPQYIVPLSEASVDLIFAPAYGSNKKNATDIRMAIDALELIFIRPEIGTYILLTGDSDFSSLVLKLKEYGKYVIGVGIQESSSDILVQNCDEYYSYTSLTGLTKTTELGRSASDPWVLVKDAVAKMVKRGDVMRSDRLKQVMQELDPTFDEGSIGFSKFSKFLAEASSRGLVTLKRLENGQYEVVAGSGRPSRREDGRSRRDRGRGRGRDRQDRPSRGREGASEAESDSAPGGDGVVSGGDPLNEAYDALRGALSTLRDAGREPVRDSDVKRKILERHRGFDETELGFPKFSRFLAQAEEHGVVSLERTEAGNLDVTLRDEDSTAPDGDAGPGDRDRSEPNSVMESGPTTYGSSAGTADAATEPPIEPQQPAEPEPVMAPVEEEPQKRGWFGLRLGPRRGATRRRTEEVPGLLEGQAAKAPSTPLGSTTSVAPEASLPTPEVSAPPPQREAPSRSENTAHVSESSGQSEAPSASVPIEDLALPTDPGAIVRYLTHRYKGVGEKTAETLVEELGSDLFRTMQEDPDAIARIVPASRATQVLEAWRSDYERRAAIQSGSSEGSGDSGRSGGSRRGGRGRSRGSGRS
jgi:uncharacterized protein (TIGR00288 family)